MRKMNTFQGGTVSGNKSQLQKPVLGFDPGNICTRMRIEAAVNLASSDSSNYTLTNADAIAVMACIFATWTMSFGDRAKDTVDDSMSFYRMRELCIVMTGRDFIFNGVQLYAYSTTNGQFVVPHGSNATVYCEFIRAFIVQRLGFRETKWCPGAEQISQVDLSITRGGNWTIDTGDVTQGATTQFTGYFDNEPGDARWVRVVRTYLSDVGGLKYALPGGILLSLYEYTDAAASSPIGLITLTPYGDSPIHDEVEVTRIVREAQLLYPLGSYDLNQLVTEMYQTPESVDWEELPISKGYLWKMATLDISPAQIAMVYVPEVDLPYVDQIAGPNMAFKFGGECKLVNEHALEGRTLKNPTKGACDAMGVMTRQHPKFNKLPGRLFRNGVPPVTHVPETVLRSARAKIRRAGGHKSSAGLGTLATQVVHLSAAIPGGISSQRRDGGGETQLALANMISKEAVAAHGTAAIAGLTRFGTK